MKKLMTLAVIAGLGAWTSASATVISGNGLQNTLTGAGANIDVHTDQHNSDEIWQIGATGLAGARLLFEFSAYANSNAFGVYDVWNPHRTLTIFQGAINPGQRGLLTFDNGTFCAGLIWGGAPNCLAFDSQYFGLFLDTPEGTFYSERSRNGDGIDHMVTFAGGEGRGTVGGSPWTAGEYIFGWEDLWGGGDRDYEDFIGIIESVVSVSEPGTLALYGVGLFGIFFMGRRLRARARG